MNVRPAAESCNPYTARAPMPSGHQRAGWEGCSPKGVPCSAGGMSAVHVVFAAGGTPTPPESAPLGAREIVLQCLGGASGGTRGDFSPARFKRRFPAVASPTRPLIDLED